MKAKDKIALIRADNIDMSYENFQFCMDYYIKHKQHIQMVRMDYEFPDYSKQYYDATIDRIEEIYQGKQSLEEKFDALGLAIENAALLYGNAVKLSIWLIRKMKDQSKFQIAGATRAGIVITNKQIKDYYLAKNKIIIFCQKQIYECPYANCVLATSELYHFEDLYQRVTEAKTYGKE